MRTVPGVVIPMILGFVIVVLVRGLRLLSYCGFFFWERSTVTIFPFQNVRLSYTLSTNHLPLQSAV